MLLVLKVCSIPRKANALYFRKCNCWRKMNLIHSLIPLYEYNPESMMSIQEKQCMNQYLTNGNNNSCSCFNNNHGWECPKGTTRLRVRLLSRLEIKSKWKWEWRKKVLTLAKSQGISEPLWEHLHVGMSDAILHLLSALTHMGGAPRRVGQFCHHQNLWWLQLLASHHSRRVSSQVTRGTAKHMTSDRNWNTLTLSHA